MKYKDLLFTPIDFAVPDINFGDINITHSKPSYSPYWNFEQLLDHPDPYKGRNSWRTDLDFARFQLKDMVLQLPLTDLYNVRLTIQTSIVKPHVDINQQDTPEDCYTEYVESEPCGYRFVLKGSTTSLKMHNNGKILTAQLPSVPGLYLLNSTAGVHSLDGDIGRITLYVRGRINKEKHFTLIESSLEKYEKYAIWK
jgi:hypothetical protein